MLKRWAWALAFLLGVPAVGVGTAAVLETVANTRMQSALARGQTDSNNDPRDAGQRSVAEASTAAR